MSDHVASLAIYILACRPALFEKAAAVAFTAELFAMLDVFRHLLPLVFVSARCIQSSFALLRLPNFSCHARIAVVRHRVAVSTEPSAADGHL